MMTTNLEGPLSFRSLKSLGAKKAEVSKNKSQARKRNLLSFSLERAQGPRKLSHRLKRNHRLRNSLLESLGRAKNKEY